MSQKLRVVFDCNTFLQALASPEGPSARCVQFALAGHVVLFVSPSVLAELRDVASRPRIVNKLRLTPRRVDDVVEMIQLASIVLQSFPEEFHLDRDPDDAHYVNLALAAQAKFIVTRDNDLLDLMDPKHPGSSEFQAQYPELRIVTPVRLLLEVTGRA